MSDKAKLDSIKKRIEEFYVHALIRPQVLCRPVEIEAFVLAIESILDCMSDSTPRTDSYRAFLDESAYGATRFESKFERVNSCSLSYSGGDCIQGSTSSLDDKFSVEFHEHWSKFLGWRSERSKS